MGVIKKLYGKELVGWTQDPNTEIYPITHVGGVYDSNGNTLEELLGDMNNRIDYGGGGSGSGSSSVQPIIYLWAYCTASSPSDALSKLANRNQQADVPNGFYADISEAERRLTDNQLIYMTTARRQGYNYMTWTDHYIWSVPIRMGNGETSGTGVDGDSVNYIYCRRKAGAGRPTVPNNITVQMVEFQSASNGQGYNESGQPSSEVYNVWYDHPLGISEEYPEEWVTIAEGNDPEHDKYNTTATLWSRWGFNGRDGDGTEYIFMRTTSDASAPTWRTPYHGRIGETETGATYYDVDIDNIETDTHYQQDDFIPEGWHDEPQELNSTYPIQYVSIRKRQWVTEESKSKWGQFSTPKVWSSVAETSGYSVTINNDAIILDDDTGANDVKNVSCTKIHIWEGTAEITNDATYDYDVTINQRNGADYYFGVEKVTAISNGAVTTAPLSDASFEHAYAKSALYTNNLGLVLCLTKENNFINKDFSIEYNIKIYKIVNGSRSAQPVAEVSRSQAVKVADFNNGAAYQLQVTPNSMPVSRDTAQSSYHFPTDYSPVITVTARKSMEGNVSIQQIHYPSEEANLHTGDMFVEVKGVSFTGTETSSSYATQGTGSGALDSLTFTLNDAYTNCSAYIVNLYFVSNNANILVDTETVDFTVQGDRGIDGVGSYTLELDNDNAILDDNTVINADIREVTETHITLKYGTSPVDSTITPYTIKLDALSLPPELVLKDLNGNTISSVDSTIAGDGFYLATTGNPSPSLLTLGDVYYVRVKAMVGNTWAAAKTFGLKIKNMNATGTVYRLNITNDSWSYESDNSIAGSAATSILTVNAYTNGEPEVQSFTVKHTPGAPSAESGFVLVSPVFSTTTSTPEQSFTLTQGIYASNGYDVELYYNGDLVDSEHIDCVKNGAQGPAGPSGDADAADFYTLMPIKTEALVGVDDKLTIDVAFNIQYTHGSNQDLVTGSGTYTLPAGYSLNVEPYLANGNHYPNNNNPVSYLVKDTDGNGVWTFEDENHQQKVIDVQTAYSEQSNSQIAYFVARLTNQSGGTVIVKDSVNIPVRFANGVFFEINQERRTITARIQESEVKATNLLSTKADWYYTYGGSNYHIPATQYASDPYRYKGGEGDGDIYSPPILLPTGEYTVSVYSNEPISTFNGNIYIILYGSTYPSSLDPTLWATVTWSTPVENENINIGGTIYYHYVTAFSLNESNYVSINWFPGTDDWLVMPQLYFKSIASNFSSIIQKADSINASVSSLETTVNDANTGLVKKVTDLTATAEGITSTVSTIRNNFGAENLFSFNEAVNANFTFPYLYLVPEHYGAAIKWVANSNHTAWKRDWHVINLNKSIEAGKYTFSMKIYNSSANSVPLIFQLTNGTQIEEAGVTRSFQGPSTSINLDPGENNVSFTLDTADGSDTWTTNIGVLNFGVSSGVINTNNQTVYTDFSLYIHYLKMEAGEMPTAFRISSVDENAISQGSLIDAWTTETGKVSLEGTYNSMPVYKAACNLRNSSDTKWRMHKSNVTVKDNTCYTLSFWAKADVDGTEIQQNFYDHGGISRDDNSSKGQSYYGDINTTLTTQWKHYVHYWYTDFESAVIATVDWGQNVVITPGRMYYVGAANQAHRKLWASYSVDGELRSFNMQSVNSSTESQYFSDTIDVKTVVGLQIMSEYETSVDNTKYVYIAGLSFDEGYVGEGPSSSSSMIKQTADLIKLQVEDCGIDIDKKKITLNGNTEINGTLNLYDDTTGFILNGLGGITQISPKSVGNYYTDFKNISETVFNRTETTAGLFVSNSGPYALFKYDYYIYLGKYNRQTTITFNSITSRFYNSSNSNIIGNIINDRTVQIVEIYNSSTVTTTKNYGAFTYTVANNDADIYLAINMTIGHLLSKLGSINATPYCDLTIQYEVPNDAFTLIGYDGIGINFGTGANIFFNKNEATFRYGNYGLKISNGNISKFIGERDTLNNEVWVNLNTPKIKVTNNNVSIWPTGTDMIVTTLNSGSSYQTVYLPSAPYTGRTVYIRKRGVSNVKVYATNTMMLGYNNTVNVGSYIEIDSGKEYKFTYDGTYWLVNYMD